MASPEKFLKPAPEAEKTGVERLRELMQQPESPKEKSEVKTMTIGKLEEFQNFLKSASAERILGRDFKIKEKMYGEDKEQELQRIQKEDALILDFLRAEAGLDSNTKRKLYHRIMEEDWQPKLEEAAKELEAEIEALEILKETKDRPMTREELNKFYSASGNFLDKNKGEKSKLIKNGLFSLREFGFDKERLKLLEDRFKKAKK